METNFLMGSVMINLIARHFYLDFSFLLNLRISQIVRIEEKKEVRMTSLINLVPFSMNRRQYSAWNPYESNDKY